MLAAYCFMAIFSAVLSNPKNDLMSILADCSKQVQSSFSGWTCKSIRKTSANPSQISTSPWREICWSCSDRVAAVFSDDDSIGEGLIVGLYVQCPLSAVQRVLLNEIHVFHSCYLHTDTCAIITTELLLHFERYKLNEKDQLWWICNALRMNWMTFSHCEIIKTGKKL